MKTRLKTGFALVALLLPGISFASDDATAAMNMVWLVTASALVFFMQAGFAMLEAGLTRAKNALNVVMKNYMDVCFGTVVFWAIGYGLMFGTNTSGLFGADSFFLNTAEPTDWGFMLFQLMFAATAATIASGTLAERTRYNAYIIASIAITAVIYPVFGSWVWNSGGWLAERGFIDFAGSTVVHSVGAWCALAGALVVGPRLGRFDKQGKPHEIRGHNLTMVAIGGFILWFGWFGFNGGSTLEATVDIGLINLNTQLAAAAGACGACLTAVILRRPIMLTDTVNGSIGGLVGITAGCASMLPGHAIITGLIAGVVVYFGVRLLLSFKIDDVVGAVSVHGFAGAWGTFAAGLFFAEDPFNPSIVMVQVVGILACFAWTFFSALAVFMALKLTIGVRADALHEQRGLDLTEHAELGYPEFAQASAYDANVATAMEAKS